MEERWRPQWMIDQEERYRRRRLHRIAEINASGEDTPERNPSVRSYAEILLEENLQKKKQDILKKITKKEEVEKIRCERDTEERNRPFTGEELDSMFPQEGYEILGPPASYIPVRTPTPMGTDPFV